MMNLRLCAPVVAVLLSFGLGCTDDDGDVEATLTVINESDFVIEEIYLTQVGSRVWGGNLLGVDPLFPEEEITLGVRCGFYDALLIDEEGAECTLEAIDLCLNDATWFIYNDTCVAFERKAPAGATPEEVKAPPADAATAAP